MNTSIEISEIAAACAKAQQELKPAEKAAENEAFKRGGKPSKYADLAAIITAVRVYAMHDVAIFQAAGSTPEGARVVTRLVHKSGQWIETDPLVIPLASPTAHALGSAITYAKRYQLQGMTLVAADEDDDGNAAAQAAPVRTLKRPDYFADWLKDLELAANAGMAALETTWKASNQDLRDYLTLSDPDRLEKLKAAAAKVPKVKANAPA